MFASRKDRAAAQAKRLDAEKAARRAHGAASREVDQLASKAEGLLQELLAAPDEKAAIATLRLLRSARAELMTAKQTERALRTQAVGGNAEFPPIGSI